MEYWLDSANLSEAKEADSLEIKLQGFTTNPSLWLEGYKEIKNSTI